MQYDVIIIGGGHNGLTCAGYLGKAGLKVKVLEKRPIVGGACVTEEFHPGFKNSTCSYVVSKLHPSVIEDLDLKKHGLDITERESGMLSILPDNRHLVISDDTELTFGEIRKYSHKDAEAHPLFLKELEEMANILRDFDSSFAPNMGHNISDIWGMIKTSYKIQRLGREKQERLFMILTQSIGDYLDSWFESPEVKGYYAYDAAVGHMNSPYSGGSAFVLLQQHLGKINGKTGAWGHVKGGMGSITQAMAKYAEQFNVDIETSTTVKEILTTTSDAKNQIHGVLLEDGREIIAPVVVGNCTAKILFLDLLKGKFLPEQFKKRVQNWRYRSGTFRINVALDELPKFTTLAGRNEEKHMNRSINICPTLNYIEEAYFDAKIRGWSRQPIISLNIPTLADSELAPEGKHVASVFCQHFNPRLPDGLDWDVVKDEAIDLIFETINTYAPNFRESILGYSALSPKDLEKEFSLTGGDIYHGSMHLDQLYAFRPALGYAQYKMPVENLYLCGAGAHPGGSVSGLPGKFAAQALLKNYKPSVS